MPQDKSENLIKQVCEAYNLSYSELANEIGYGEGAIKNSVSIGKISQQMEKAIRLFLRIKELEKEVSKANNFKQNLKEFLQD